MDAVSEKIKIDAGYSDDCTLIRNGHKSMVKDNIPKASLFSPDGGMSTDWNKFTTHDECLIRVGLTYKFGKTVYKDHNEFLLFGLKVSDLKLIEGVNSINYTPIPQNEKQIGKPYNLSHTDVHFVDEELRIKFVGIATPLTNFDLEKIDDAVQKGRQHDIEKNNLKTT